MLIKSRISIVLIWLHYLLEYISIIRCDIFVHEHASVPLDLAIRGIMKVWISGMELHGTEILLSDFASSKICFIVFYI